MPFRQGRFPMQTLAPGAQDSPTSRLKDALVAAVGVDAVERLLSGQSIGKVVVDLEPESTRRH